MVAPLVEQAMEFHTPFGRPDEFQDAPELVEMSSGPVVKPPTPYDSAPAKIALPSDEHAIACHSNSGAIVGFHMIPELVEI
jgi:hypothetical protein